MKNKKVTVKEILIIVLLIVIISLGLINLKNKNLNIEKQKIETEQLTDTTNANAYVSMDTHLSEISQLENNMSGQMELIYTNTDSLYAGTSGTLTIDLSNYEAIYITFRNTDSSFITRVDSNNTSSMYNYSTDVGFGSYLVSTSAGHSYGRKITVTSSNIKFGQTRIYNINTRAWENVTSSADPLRPEFIYGIK